MKRSEIILMVLQIPLDFLMLLLAGTSAYYLRFSDSATAWREVQFALTLPEYLQIVTFVALLWVALFIITGLYIPDPNRKLLKDLYRVFMVCSVGLAGVALYILFSQQLFDSRFLVAASFGFAVLYVSLGRLGMRGVKAILYRLGIGLRRVVIIGSDDISSKIVAMLKKRKELGYTVIAEYKEFISDKKNELLKLNPDEVIFTNPRAHTEEAISAIEFCHEHHIIFKYSADLFATYAANMRVNPLAGVPIVELRRTRLDGWGRVLKRVFDIFMSILMIILTSPILLLTAVIILFESGRPVIYKNERVGIRGKNFTTYKFRSMYQKYCTGKQFGTAGEKAIETEKKLIKEKNTKAGPLYKIANDPRITPFGRFIRRWSIDELPQFFNVIAGDMSMVGPRPHQPREVAHYERHHKTVLTLKPGITGLAQVSGRSDLSFEEEVKLDIFYIEKWNIFIDIVLFLKTPFILFKKRKAL